MDDNIIKMYIDQVFQVYDSDRNGTLDLREVHAFFNQLYASMNDPRRFTEQQMRAYFSKIDLQKDGRITKPQLFLVFKMIWENPYASPLNDPIVPNGQRYNPNTNIPNNYGQGQYGNNFNNNYGQGQYGYNNNQGQYGNGLNQYGGNIAPNQGTYNQGGQYGQGFQGQGQYYPPNNQWNNNPYK